MRLSSDLTDLFWYSYTYLLRVQSLEQESRHLLVCFLSLKMKLQWQNFLPCSITCFPKSCDTVPDSFPALMPYQQKWATSMKTLPLIATEEEHMTRQSLGSYVICLLRIEWPCFLLTHKKFYYSARIQTVGQLSSCQYWAEETGEAREEVSAKGTFNVFEARQRSI